MNLPNKQRDNGILRLRPRYYRWFVDTDTEWSERTTDYAFLDWQVPVIHTALVLVDVWDGHYLSDTEDRINRITTNKLEPFTNRCRTAGVQIIHAPSPPIAVTHEAWVGPVSQDNSSTGMDIAWPPAEFRTKCGGYLEYARPQEARQKQLDRLRAGITLHPALQPCGADVVVATGAELNMFCQNREILFLLYAGFCTNGCILTRDYGTLAMISAGYEVLLVRDCTTGMEAAWTQDGLMQTNGATLMLEMFGGYSIGSDEVRFD